MECTRRLEDWSEVINTDSGPETKSNKLLKSSLNWPLLKSKHLK